MSLHRQDPAPRLAWLEISVALVLLGGCAATPVEGTSPLLRAAAAQARVGEEAYLGGHASEAVPTLNEAVRLHLAGGDLPGASRALLNLALAQRAAGDAAAAAATAARLTELTPAALQQAHEARAPSAIGSEIATATNWLNALLALDRGDFPTASAQLSAVSGSLPGSSAWSGRVANLRAELALGEGRLMDALTLARSGQVASAAARDRAEEARSWRIAGTAEVRLARWSEAQAEFLAAVRIEEALGGGNRMAGDLTQLAAIAGRLGDTRAAELYTRRAQAITTARSP